jgi:signal transduction histidine kinase
LVGTSGGRAGGAGARRRASRALERSRARLASQIVALERGEEAAQARQRLELEVEARKRVDVEVAAAVESERLRLGYELHEGLGQELAGIGYMMATFQGVLREAGVEQAEEARRLEGMITRSIERTRTLAKAFYPVEMEMLGLVGSLEEMACSATHTLRVPCRVRDADAPAFELRGPMAIQLFRIAEEAIQFEVEQGAARRIDISVSVDGERLVLTVAGEGPEAIRELDSMNGGGAGIRRMRYRAEVIGGRLDVRSPSAGGITVRCSAPLPPAAMA